MTEREIVNKSTPTLEQRIVAALDNPNSESEALYEIIALTEVAIDAAEQNISAARAKAADVVAAPTPREAQDAIKIAESAELELKRWRGVLPKLRDKWAAAIAAERHSRWLGFFETVGAEREKLAHEFNATRAKVKTELASLNRRIKECNNDCSTVNAMAFEIDEYRELELLPLFAALDIIDVDANSPQPDWKAANSFAAAYAQSMAPPASDPSRWSDPEVQQQRRAGIEKEHREIGEFYQRQTEQQEDRLNAEERERFAASRRPT